MFFLFVTPTAFSSRQQLGGAGCTEPLLLGQPHPSELHPAAFAAFSLYEAVFNGNHLNLARPAAPRWPCLRAQGQWPPGGPPPSPAHTDPTRRRETAPGGDSATRGAAGGRGCRCRGAGGGCGGLQRGERSAAQPRQHGLQLPPAGNAAPPPGRAGHGPPAAGC